MQEGYGDLRSTSVKGFEHMHAPEQCFKPAFYRMSGKIVKWNSIANGKAAWNVYFIDDLSHT